MGGNRGIVDSSSHFHIFACKYISNVLSQISMAKSGTNLWGDVMLNTGSSTEVSNGSFRLWIQQLSRAHSTQPIQRSSFAARFVLAFVLVIARLSKRPWLLHCRNYVDMCSRYKIGVGLPTCFAHLFGLEIKKKKENDWSSRISYE